MNINKCTKYSLDEIENKTIEVMRNCNVSINSVFKMLEVCEEIHRISYGDNGCECCSKYDECIKMFEEVMCKRLLSKRVKIVGGLNR